ncbi:MAG: NUDIX hydrolase [Pseudomonadota bacterium]
MNRRFGPPPNADRYYVPRPGAYAVVVAPGGLLVTFQERPKPEFQLPGGGIDPGESSLPALRREILEETGFTIQRPRRLGMFHRFTYMPEYDVWAQKQCHIYLAMVGRKLGPPQEPGHLAIVIPWDTARSALAVDGDRYFVGLAGAVLRGGRS